MILVDDGGNLISFVLAFSFSSSSSSIFGLFFCQFDDNFYFLCFLCDYVDNVEYSDHLF